MSAMATPTNKLYKDLGTDGLWNPPLQRNIYKDDILADPKATRVVLQFLASTSIVLLQGYLQRAVERAQKDGEWELGALE